MSSMAPRGPLPARVYWVRRGIVIGVALLLVLVIGKLLTGGSDGSEKDASGARDAVALSGTEASSDAPSASVTAAAKPEKDVPLAAPSGPCDPEKVTVTAIGGERPNNGKVPIRLAIGTSEEACTFAFSPESVVVKIVSGDDNIWTSQQCSVLPTQDVVARSAKAARVGFYWNGRRSDEQCSANVAWARTGSYHVVAAAFGGEPSDTQFELTRPPGVVVTKTVQPKTTKATPSSTASGSTSTKTTAKTTSKANVGETDEP